jgi:hypothetical protein
LIAPDDSTRCVIPRDAMRCCRAQERERDRQTERGGKRRVGASRTGIPWPAKKGSRGAISGTATASPMPMAV